MSTYSQDELFAFGFKSLGKNVLISRKASIYGADKIEIGNNVRIDDFCVLSSGDDGFFIGSNIHIAPFSLMIGKGHIYLGDFVNISSRVSIYSSNDDYSGEFMTSPVVPDDFTNILKAPVRIDRHVIIGSGSIILPGIKLSEGVAIGALSLVNKNCDSFCIYAGIPAVKIKERKKNILELEGIYTKRNIANER
jgi:acetyltransferase-like isoleucine patch superfamily enzyme